MDVYVFILSNQAYLGLTLMADGGNLPRVAEGGEWEPHSVMSMTAKDIGRFTDDTPIALSNLQSRGYHLIQRSAVQLPFPQARRVFS